MAIGRCIIGVLASVAVWTTAAWAQVTVNGTPYDDLAEAFAAITASGPGSYDVRIGDDYSISPYVIPSGVNIVIGGTNAREQYGVMPSSNGSLFTVNSGAVLTLQDGVMVAGRGNNTSAAVHVNGGGVFNMNGGAIIGNSTISGDAARGGGVSVDDGGEFNMRGGVISGNYILQGGSGIIGGGGGVFVSGAAAVFNMYGGTISMNTNSVVSASVGNGAGGVYVSFGTFNMYGGDIHDNNQTGSLARAGGGVYLANGAVLNMRGGVIRNNSTTASANGNGNGVFAIGDASINLSGAPVISDGVYTGGSLQSAFKIIDGGLTDGAHIAVKGGGSAQMDAAGFVTATLPGLDLTDAMARAFISLDNTLIGKVGGTAANPRVVWAYNYEVALEPATGVVFDPAVYGYGAAGLSARTVTIRNLAMPTGELTVTLSGEHADDFALSAAAVGNIDKDGTGAFTIVPKIGLDARTHTATATVVGDHGISASVSVSFTVNPKLITVNPADIRYDGKVYDGTTAVSGPTMIQPTSLSGIIPGDEPNIAVKYDTSAAYFDDKNAGERTVTFTNAELRGTASGNYVLASDIIVMPNVPISPRDLIFKVNDLAITVGDSVRITYTLVGLVNGETAEDVVMGEPIYAVDGGYTDNLTPGVFTIEPIASVSPNYNVTFVSGTLTISEKDTFDGDGIAFDGGDFVYDGTPKSPAASYLGASGGITYKYVGTTAAGVAYNGDTPPIDAGEYIVEARYEDAEKIGKASAAFTIAPRPLTVSGARHTKVYNGARNAFDVSVTLSGVVYENGEYDDVYAAYVSASYATSNAGETALTVIEITLAGEKSSNYVLTGVPAEFIVAGITQKPITADMFTIDRQTFTGSALTPAPVGMDGSLPVTFTAGVYTNNVYAGTASLTVAGTGNYMGTLALDFDINPKRITPGMFVIEPQIYTGGELTPIPSASDDGILVTFGIDGYRDNINVGKGVVTVSGTGNYTGTIELIFPINRSGSEWSGGDGGNGGGGGGGGGSGGGGGGGGDGGGGGGGGGDDTGPWEGTGGIAIDGWTYGDEPNAPVIFSSTNSIDDALIEYKARDGSDDTYTTEVPVDAGYYTVRVTFPGNENHLEYKAAADFRIAKAKQRKPDIPALRNDAHGEPQSVPGMPDGVQRIPADISGLRVEIFDDGFHIVNDRSEEMDGWEYSIDGGNKWQDSPRFAGLKPNTEYVVSIRRKETANYLASDIEAVLIRTATAGNHENIEISNNRPETPAPVGGRIALRRSVVSGKAEFSVSSPSASTVSVAIYDNLGNVVFRKSGIRSDELITWNLNASGRRVASGTYLIVALSKGADGKIYRHSAKISVGR